MSFVLFVVKIDYSVENMVGDPRNLNRNSTIDFYLEQDLVVGWKLTGSVFRRRIEVRDQLGESFWV